MKKNKLDWVFTDTNTQEYSKGLCREDFEMEEPKPHKQPLNDLVTILDEFEYGGRN